MAEPAPVQEPLPSPERINTKEFTAVYGRIALSLKTGDNKIFDKNKKDIPVVAKNQFETNLNNQRFDAADNASTRERREQAKDKTAEQWIREHVPVFKQNFHNIEGFNENSVQRWESFVCELFGVKNQNQIDEGKIRAFYEAYCGDRTNTGAFVKKILQIYGSDFRQIESNRDVIQWVSGAFGVQYSQLEIGLHHTLVQEQLQEKNVDGFVTETNAVSQGRTLSRINDPSPEKEGHVCDYLYKGGAPLEIKPGKPTTPPADEKPPHDKKDRKEPTPDSEHPAVKTIAEMLRPVKKPVPDKKNNPYFVEEPHYPFQLTGDQLRNLSLEKEPFFVWHKGYADEDIYPNPKVTPLADELGKDPRVRAIENLTDGDSGLLALCGISADSPEKQAKIYLAVVDNILSFHEHDENAILRWIARQKFPISHLVRNPIKLKTHIIESPLDLFEEFDHITDPKTHEYILKDSKPQLRPEHEVLLKYKTDGKLDVFSEEFLKDWQTRIAVLRDAIKTGKIEPYHLRWIEFLSHSVNVMEMMKIMQTAPKPETKPADGLEKPPEVGLPKIDNVVELKSFDEVLSAAKKLEAGKPIEFKITPDGIPSLISSLIPSLEKALQDKYHIKPSIKLINLPAQIPIKDLKAAGSITANVKAPALDRNFGISFVLLNVPNKPSVQFSEIKVDPPSFNYLFKDRNIQEEMAGALSKKAFDQLIKETLQRELDKVKIGVSLENLELSFTPENILKLVLSGKKK